MTKRDKRAENNLEQYEDARVTATSRIWRLAVGMLVICIPLSPATKSGATIPLATIAGAAIGTVAIWRSDDKKSKNNYLQQQHIELLQQRLANLETIVSIDDLELQRKIHKLE